MRRSLAWIAAEISGSMGVTMITMLLMARLMTPEQFGTGALVLGGVAFISLYVGGFFHDALIQRANIGDDAFEASLTVTVLAGLAVVALAGIADAKPSPVRLASRIALGAGAYAVTLLLTDHWIRDQLIIDPALIDQNVTASIRRRKLALSAPGDSRQ